MAFFLTLILYIGLFLLSELLKPKPNIEGAKPAGLGDFNVPTAEEGRAAQLIWGTVRMNGPNIGWYGDLQTKAIKEKVKTGVFSSENVTVGHEYSLGIDFMLSRGDLSETITGGQGLRRIWIDDVELRSEAAGWVQSGTIAINQGDFFGKDAGGIIGTLRFYGGEIAQAQNGYMAGLAEIDSTLLPNYKRQCHLVLEGVYIGNAPSLRPWAFELRRIPNGLALADADALVNGNDANPANVIYEIFTNSEWGLGLSNVDETQMAAVGVILSAENNGYARILDRGLEAVELIAEVEQQIDGFLVQDPITKDWQIRLIRETDYPSPLTDVPLFDESSMLSLDFSRGAWADTTNQVKIQYTDRENEYSSTFAVAQDMANKIIQNNDDIIATEVYPAIQSAALANEIAWRDLRTLSYPLAKGKLKADRSNYQLRPGDLIRITWPPYGLENFFARITKLSLGTADANEIIYDWTEDIFRAEVPSFADPTTSLWTPLATDPVNVSSARVWKMPLGYQDVSDAQQIGLLAVRANGTQLSYDVYIKEDASLPINTARDGTIIDTTVAPFTPSALLDGSLAMTIGGSYNNDTILINTAVDIDQVNEGHVLADLDGAFPPNLALIDDEIIFFESVTDNGGGDYQMNNCYRGMLDTAVAEHSDNAQVWFFTYGIGVLKTILDPGTVGLAVWFMSSSGAGDQGDPNSSPTGSPEKGVLETFEIGADRYAAPGAAVNVSIDGVRLGDVDTLGDTFSINWRTRVPEFTARGVGKTQEDTHESASGYTYNVRVYHTGVSPEVEVFNQTGISADAGISPIGGTQIVSGYAVDFSPITSPWASPQPFGQTYRIEIEAQDTGLISQLWERDFTRA